jgi:hypothetical protein
MSVFLQEPEIVTCFRDRRKDILCSIHLDEIPLLFYQNQEAVYVQLSHPYWMQVAVLSII